MKNINITTWLRTMAACAVIGLFALLAAGCGSGREGGMPATETIASAVAPTTLNAVLSGAQEVPPVVSAGSGTATVTIDAARTTITVTLNTTGLTGVTASHIHAGAVGINGGVIFPLFAAPAAFPATLTKTLTSADFTPDAANAVNTFADAVNAMLIGNTYINVHTVAHLGGEIRGQLTP
ncbi:MAG: CHRD domain-containing protein [Deltaproteobacteria bacterium]|nr:CHRD domain-containing protein [Deltaproteobacteria bacterium]